MGDTFDNLTNTIPGDVNPFEPSYPQNGTDFGRYEGLQAIGQGGMGRVYKARDTKLNRDVAIKVLAAGAMISNEQRERFKSEINLQASLSIPGVVRIYDVGQHKDWDFYVMELVDGHELKHWVRTQKPDLEQKRDLLIRIAEILSRVHAKDIVHRDIKPGNIMITREGDPVLMDFGIAKSLRPETQTDLTQPNAWPGTPRYMSPDKPSEMKADQTKTIPKKADMYSLAVVGYELLCGKLPHEVENLSDPYEVLTVVRETDPRPITDTCPDVSVPVANAVMAGLAKEHSKRPEPAQFAEQLKAAAKSSSAPQRLAKEHSKRPEPAQFAEQLKAAAKSSSAPQRKSTVPALVAVLAALVIGVGVYAAMQASKNGGRKTEVSESPAAAASTVGGQNNGGGQNVKKIGGQTGNTNGNKVKPIEPVSTKPKIWVNAAPPSLKINWTDTKRSLKNNATFTGKGALLFQIESGQILKVDGEKDRDGDFTPMGTLYRAPGETIVVKLYANRDDENPEMFEWKPVAGQADCLK